MSMIDISGPEMDLQEGSISSGRTNSGIMLEKVKLWNDMAKALEVAFQKQLDAVINGEKVTPVDIAKLCDAFSTQQGALKNKLKGFQTEIKFVRNKPKVAVRWTQLVEQDRDAALADSRDFIKRVNSQPKGDRLLGGLNLTRSFHWEEKRYIIADSLREAEYERGDEVSKRYYFLSVGIFWHSGSPKRRSK